MKNKLFEELEKMSTKELKIIALEKNKIGNASKKAFIAQQIIWDRAEKPIYSKHFGTNHVKRTSSDYKYLS